MATTKAGQKAVNKYIAKAYDRVNLTLKKEGPQSKAAVQAAADAAGESLNAYITGAIALRMEAEGWHEAADPPAP